MRLLYLNVSGSLSWRLPYCTDLKRQTLSSSKHFVRLQNNFIIVLLIQTYWLCVPFHLCNLEKQYNVDKKISPKMHFLNKLSNRIPYLVKLSEQSVELSVKVLKLKSYKIIIITVVFLLDFSVVLLIWTDSCLSKLDPSQIAWSLPLVSECDTILTLNIDFNTSVSCVTTTLVVNYINNQPCYLHTNVMGLTTSTFWPSPLKLAALVYDAHFRSVTPPPSVFVCECVFACVRVCARGLLHVAPPPVLTGTLFLGLTLNLTMSRLATVPVYMYAFCVHVLFPSSLQMDQSYMGSYT